MTSETYPSGRKLNYGHDQYGNMWVPSTTGIPLQGGTVATVNNYNTATNRINGASYDAAGNLLSFTGSALTYDGENRIASASQSGIGSMYYFYDGAGRRVQEVSTYNIEKVFVYDVFGQMAAEYSIGAQSAACRTCYIATDHVGSTRMVTDQNANVVARHDYLPFGEEIGANSGGRNSLFGTQDFVNQKFTGQERDSETGLDFFQARYFSAALGRFNSPDPSNAGANLFNPQSWNGYSYVGNSPLTRTDPSGMSWLSDVWSGIAAGVAHFVSGNEYPDYCLSFSDNCGPVHEGANNRSDPLSGGAGFIFYARGMGHGDVQTVSTPSSAAVIPATTGMAIPPKSGTCPAVPTGPGAPVLNSNIIFARNFGQAFNILDGPLAGLAAKLVWFRSMVKNGSVWDYKNQPYPHAHPEYAGFGNLNFGATGDALGLPAPILLRGAGYAQEKAGTSASAWGHWWGSSPYGDDPADQQQIKNGIQYVEQGCH